jgi:hypothetical protein
MNRLFPTAGANGRLGRPAPIEADEDSFYKEILCHLSLLFGARSNTTSASSTSTATTSTSTPSPSSSVTQATAPPSATPSTSASSASNNPSGTSSTTTNIATGGGVASPSVIGSQQTTSTTTASPGTSSTPGSGSVVSSLFSSSANELVSRHVSLCRNALGIFSTLARSIVSERLSSSTWDMFLRLLMGIAEQLLKGPTGIKSLGNELETQILRVLFDVWYDYQSPSSLLINHMTQLWHK